MAAFLGRPQLASLINACLEGQPLRPQPLRAQYLSHEPNTKYHYLGDGDHVWLAVLTGAAENQLKMASSRFGSHAALCGTCALLVDYVLTYDPELALLIMVINKLHFLGGLSLLPIGDARPLRLNHAQGQAVNAAARGALTRRYSKVPAPHSRASLVPDSSKKSQPERDPPTLANNEVDESNTQDDVLYALTAVMGTYVGSASSPLHAQHGSVAGPSNLTPAENLSDTQAAVQDALDVLHEREDARRAAGPAAAFHARTSDQHSLQTDPPSQTRTASPLLPQDLTSPLLLNSSSTPELSAHSAGHVGDRGEILAFASLSSASDGPALPWQLSQQQETNHLCVSHWVQRANTSTPGPAAMASLPGDKR